MTERFRCTVSSLYNEFWFSSGQTVTTRTSAGTEVISTNITTQISLTYEILIMITSTIITTQTSATSVITEMQASANFTTSEAPATTINQAPAIFTTPSTSESPVMTPTTASKETTVQTSIVQTAAPVSEKPKPLTSSYYSPPSSGRPPITLPPKETTTTINKCTDTKNCHIDTETKATGKIFTSTAADQKTSFGTDKTITKFTTTTYIQTITQIFPGYTTTITVTTNGNVQTYETYYPPTTVVMFQPVTATVPIEDTYGTPNNIGTNFKDNNGLVNIILSLWLVSWSLVYMILT
ncbi:4637_t:CDS:2 [Cetraspora pellucida]|uniref:4637_t:CDS:1 n=1 Tax=Cetraspora pellucida TaxID=1433469 RepID=A0ACA9M4S6_9GLOM|nr:4637_t:CDS:2 [Cetraspora pellucida]